MSGSCKQFFNQTLRGMRDFTSENAALLKFIEDVSISTMKNFGYSFVELPILERTEIFFRSIGTGTDIVSKEMYTFLDKSNESVTLRPEGTASAVRALINGGFQQKLPQKWMYFGPMFRYERPQKGRFREFFQFGCEFFGSESFTADVECIVAANELLDKLKIKNKKLFINTIGDLESRNRFKIELVKYFSGVFDKLSEDSKIRLNKNPLRILDSKEECDILLCENAPKLSNFLNEDSKIFFKNLCDLLNSLKINYEIDEKLVRGLDYYTHTVFEIKTSFNEENVEIEEENFNFEIENNLKKANSFFYNVFKPFSEIEGINENNRINQKNDNKNNNLGNLNSNKLITICGGGRYNDLVELMGGSKVPSVGFAFGVDRLIEIISKKITPKKNLVGIVSVSEKESLEAFNVAENIRKTLNIGTFISFEKTISKKLKSCQKNDIDVVVIFGEEEIKNNILKIKFLNDFKAHTNGTELEIDSFELINFFKNLFF